MKWGFMFSIGFVIVFGLLIANWEFYQKDDTLSNYYSEGVFAKMNGISNNDLDVEIASDAASASAPASHMQQLEYPSADDGEESPYDKVSADKLDTWTPRTTQSPDTQIELTKDKMDPDVRNTDEVRLVEQTRYRLDTDEPGEEHLWVDGDELFLTQYDMSLQYQCNQDPYALLKLLRNLYEDIELGDRYFFLLCGRAPTMSDLGDAYARQYCDAEPYKVYQHLATLYGEVPDPQEYSHTQKGTAFRFQQICGYYPKEFDMGLDVAATLCGVQDKVLLEQLEMHFMSTDKTPYDAYREICGNKGYYLTGDHDDYVTKHDYYTGEEE